jgi:hypothetical protein
MLEKVTPKGVIKYRMPNVVDGTFFIGLLLRYGKDFEVFKSELVRNLYRVIDLNGAYESFEQANDDAENMMIPLGEISEEIIEYLTKAMKKKS